MRQKINNEIDNEGEIAELAEGIARYSLYNFSEINPEILAYENNITFSYGDYGEDFDGMLEYKNGKFHIYINTKGYGKNARTLFSFAHELGHFFIPTHSNALASGVAPAHSSFTGFVSENIVERQADHFAANLLMPKNEVLDIRNGHRRFSFEIIKKISSTFQVSELAALYRVFYLGLHPMMIVKMIDGEIISNPARSSDFYFRLNDIRKPPEDSCAFSYFETGKKYQKAYKLWVLDWFDTDIHSNMYEYCIYYDSLNMVYSILWLD